MGQNIGQKIGAIFLGTLVIFVGCGPVSEEALPARAPIVGRYAMRALSTDPHAAEEIGRRALGEIGYTKIIELAVEKGWITYEKSNDGNSPEKPSRGNFIGQTPEAQAAAGAVFTRAAVVAGVASQVDSPVPGPGDAIGLGIIIVGLTAAGVILVASWISTSAPPAPSAKPVPTATTAEGGLETGPCWSEFYKCLDTIHIPPKNRTYGPKKPCGDCFGLCKHQKGVWPDEKCPLD